MARVEAFSDGVFAFAVTLLVLGIRIPRLDNPDASVGLQQLVLQQWPSYVAFALTFSRSSVLDRWSSSQVQGRCQAVRGT